MAVPAALAKVVKVASAVPAGLVAPAATVATAAMAAMAATAGMAETAATAARAGASPADRSALPRRDLRPAQLGHVGWQFPGPQHLVPAGHAAPQ
jgi:hypothetical protein